MVIRSRLAFLATVLFLAAAVSLSACSAPEAVVQEPAPDARTPDLPLPTAVSAPHTIIPLPASADLSPDETFALTEASQIVVESRDAEVERVARYLAALIGNTVETTPDVVAAGEEGTGPHIRFESGRGRTGASEEGYDLRITPEGVTLTASAPAGFFYGVQTIRQLMPAYVEYGAAYVRPLTMPTGRITDAPRFEWRGAMLDVSRHFLPPVALKRYMDWLALYKMNRLHLHLSDDQGWRIEIPGRPRLTEHGASTEVGGGPSGFFSTEEWADLIAYAEDLFITIVPEIDTPGHTNAALASYPELTCTGEAPELYTGTEVGFSYLCVEKEETYEFFDDVVREIAGMTPGPYFHLGGDEVHELTPEQYVQFMERAQEIVASHGKRVVGWDEIAEVDLGLLPGTIVQVWRPQNPETAEHIADAVAAGASLVLSPADRVYLDMKYDSSTVLGLAWAGYNSVQDAYDWEPTEYLSGVPEEAILGVEAAIWAETLDKIADVEYMAFPRLAGVAEIGWSPAERRSWNSYRMRLGAHAPRWTALGINFRRAPEVPWQQ